MKVKWFRAPEDLLFDFEMFCKYRGLHQSETICDLISKYLSDNVRNDQQTLTAYPKKHDPIIALFDQGKLIEARKQLVWIADLLEKEPAKLEEIQLDLARGLRMAEPIYVRTRDPELWKLLERIRVSLNGQKI